MVRHPESYPSDIAVSKVYMPDWSEVSSRLERVYNSGQFTNNGPELRSFEQGLSRRFGVNFMTVVANGTLALQLGIRALKLQGEVITTPFTYIATATSLVWQHCKPVFADIATASFNVCPDRVRSKITSKTSGILVTHCFGWPAEIEALESIAKEHGLALIYDAAHAAGSSFNGQPILQFGDLSAISFHATKILHMIEGGGIATPHAHIEKAVRELRNFGHRGESEFGLVGTNAKNSELHSAVGNCMLAEFDNLLQSRRRQVQRYWNQLATAGLMPLSPYNLDWNCAYAPIVMDNEKACLRVRAALEQQRIFPRRYFFPALNKVHDWSSDHCPEAEQRAAAVLCLPLYHTLKDQDIDRVCQIVLNAC